MNKNFKLFILGRFVSILGTGIQNIALPLYILDITKSAVMFGKFVSLTILPSILILPFVGVIADKLNKKKIMVNCDIVSGILTFLMFLLVKYAKNPFYLLIVLQVLLLSVNSFFVSSTMAFFSEIVEGKDLKKASGISEVNNNLGKIVAPVIGGIIFMNFGIKWIFIINSISFFLSAVTEMFIKYKKIKNNKEFKISFNMFFKDIKEVIEYISKKNKLKEIVILAVFLNVILMPIFTVVLPYGFRVILKMNSKEIGTIETIFVVGTLVSSILYTKYNEKLKFGKYLLLLIFNLLLFAYGIIFKSLTTDIFIYTLILYLLFSSLLTFINIPIMVEFQQLVDNNIKSRFFSIFIFLSQILVPLTSYIYGKILQNFKINIFLFICSILSIFFLIILKNQFKKINAFVGVENK
jgi:MFS family permease